MARKMKGEAIVRAEEQITNTHCPENNSIDMGKNENDESNIRSSIVKLDPNNSGEKKVENNMNHIQEQIELEPIHIKYEPFNSDEEKGDNETTRSCQDENNKRKKSTEHPRKVETIPNKCYICDTILESKSDFNDHLESHMNMLPYKCSQCSTEAKPIRASTVRALNKHLETHGFNYICPCCPLRYRISSSLATHTRNMHNEQKNKYHCETCGKIFTNRQAFRRHVKAHEDLKMQRYRCEPCQKVCSSRRHLQLHQMSHMCVRNTEKKSQPNINTKQKSECKSLHSKEKNIGEAIFEEAEKKITTNSQENIDDILEQHETGESIEQIVIVKLDPQSSEGKYIENNVIRDKIAVFTQEKIEHEPIDIKDEPCTSDDEKMDIYYTTDSRYTESDKPCLLKERKQWKKHPKEVEPIPNKCYICDIILESNIDRNKHLESHKDMLPYTCLQCSTETNPIISTTVLRLNRHLESHGFNYVCPHCPLRYRCSRSLMYHINLIHNEQKFEHNCETCGKVFTNISALRIHLVDHKNHKLQRYKCKLCQKDFRSLFSLKNHLASHTTQQSSSQCKNASELHGKNESSHSQVRTLRKRSRKSVKIIPNKCFICDTIFQSKNGFDDHLESHKNMLPYKCLQCSTEAIPIQVPTVKALNKHFRMHGFYFICPHCPLRFRLNRVLTCHIQNAHENLEYNCKTCGKVFTSSQAYRNHVDAHRDLALQRYKCEPCQKLFPSRRYLAAHRKSKQCMRNTEKISRLKMTTEEVVNCQPSLIKEKSKHEAIFEHTVQIITFNLPENDNNVPEQNEIEESNNQSTIVKFDPDDLEGSNVENNVNHNESAGFIQTHIELEPIDIKNEPPESNDEEMSDNETSHNYDNDNYKPSPLNSQEKRKGYSKKVKTIPNKCFICDTILGSKSDFTDHLASHKNLLPYKCLQCSTETNPIKVTTMKALNKHFESHGFNYICPQCPLRYRAHSSFSYHIRNFHNAQKFEFHCEICGEVFNNNQMFRNHVNGHKNLAAQRYKCEFCQNVFKSLQLLQKHRKSHTKRQHLIGN